MPPKKDQNSSTQGTPNNKIKIEKNKLDDAFFDDNDEAVDVFDRVQNPILVDKRDTSYNEKPQSGNFFDMDDEKVVVTPISKETKAGKKNTSTTSKKKKTVETSPASPTAPTVIGDPNFFQVSTTTETSGEEDDDVLSMLEKRTRKTQQEKEMQNLRDQLTLLKSEAKDRNKDINQRRFVNNLFDSPTQKKEEEKEPHLPSYYTDLEERMKSDDVAKQVKSEMIEIFKKAGVSDDKVDSVAEKSLEYLKEKIQYIWRILCVKFLTSEYFVL